MTERRLSNLLLAGILLCVAGAVISGVISNVHAKIDALGDGYTSFCNVNDSVNCDRVLSSPYAKVFGIPVAWFALLAYAATGAMLLLARQAEGRVQARWMALSGIAIAGSLAFSTYMAAVSFFVLKTVCLLCTGLYIVTLGLLAVALLSISQAIKTPLGGGSAVSYRNFAAAVGLSALAVAGVAAANWPAVGTLPADLLTLEDVRDADPQFYVWYTDHPVKDAPSGERNVLGPDEAPVTIIEFSDLQCGHCRRNHDRLKGLLERRPDDVRVVYRHFPLDVRCNEVVGRTIHAYACRAAEASECAALQGRFGDMIDILFANQQQLFDANLPRLAGKIGLDVDAFNACMEAGQTVPQIVEDARAGSRMNITSTPTLYINGREIRGSFEHDVSYDYAILIESLLAKQGSEG